MASIGIDDTTVLVTGASGFIATHVVQQLQQAGYKVRGTVRSLDNEQKIKPLRELCPGAKHEVELVEADLTSPDGWEEAIRGCTYVIHTASPFPASNPKHESELIKPAVEGTLLVMRACCKVGGVSRVVLTSSVASVSGGFDVGGSYNENDWTDVDKVSMAYVKSKTLAEKAAWDFLQELPNGSATFELAVINPSYVMGPVLCGGWATSLEVPKRLLERDMPLLPHIKFSMVDVRDVASAHIAAMTQPDAAGQRHILSSHNLWFNEIAQIYSEEFHALGYNVPTREAPYCFVKILSLCDKTIQLILPSWGKENDYNNSRMRNILNIEPRPVRDTLIAMAYSMIEKGFIRKTSKYVKLKGNPV